MSGFRAETPADVLLRAGARRREFGNPGEFRVPGGGGPVLTPEEQEALRRVLEAMGRKRGFSLGNLFGL